MKRTKEKAFYCFLILLQFGGCATMGPSIKKADGLYDDKNPGSWAVYKIREDSLKVDKVYFEGIDRGLFYNKSTEVLVKTNYIGLMHRDSSTTAIGAKADSLRWKKQNPIGAAFGGFGLGWFAGALIGGVIAQAADKDTYVCGVLGAMLGGAAMASRFVYRSRMPNPLVKDKRALCSLVEKYNNLYDEHLINLQYPLIQAPRGQRLRKKDFISKLKEVQVKSQRYLPEADSFRLQLDQQIKDMKYQDSVAFSKALPKKWENEEPPADRVNKVSQLIKQYNKAVNEYIKNCRESMFPNIKS